MLLQHLYEALVIDYVINGLADTKLIYTPQQPEAG
jgi:hypothetical protein